MTTLLKFSKNGSCLGKSTTSKEKAMGILGSIRGNGIAVVTNAPADQVHRAVTIAATQKKHFFDRAVMPFFTEIDPGVINQSFEFEADAALASRDLNFVIVMFDYEDRVVLAMLCGGEVSMKFGDFGRGKIRIFAKRTAALLIAQGFQASVA